MEDEEDLLMDEIVTSKRQYHSDSIPIVRVALLVGSMLLLGFVTFLASYSEKTFTHKFSPGNSSGNTPGSTLDTPLNDIPSMADLFKPRYATKLFKEPGLFHVGLDTIKYDYFIQSSLFHGASEGEYRIGFTILEKEQSLRVSCVEPSDIFIVRIIKSPDYQMDLVATNVGCFVSQGSSKEINQFYSASFAVPVNETFTYEIGHRNTKDGGKPLKGAFSSFVKKSGMVIGVLGDTGTQGRGIVFQSFSKYTEYATVVHLGDFSYASNGGTCWPTEVQAQSQCMYNCSSDMKCEGRSRQDEKHCNFWKSFESNFRSISSSYPVMTTMGNHDNDLQWFLRNFPPLSASMPNTKMQDTSSRFQNLSHSLSTNMKGAEAAKQQAFLNMLLPEGIFYSYDVGLVHFISIQTEDNAIDAYERATDAMPSLTLDEELRFNQHFGKDSAQYKWLLRDLESVDRKKTPWIVLFSHRPMFHSSSHHQSCSKNGNWYKCSFRYLYSKVYEKYGVNLVLSGHSHHYSRSTPLVLDKKKIPRASASNSSPVYIVNGVGGMKIDKGFIGKPDWIAFRSDAYYGFGTLLVHNETYMQWDCIDAATSRVMDTAMIVQKG